MGFSFRLHIAPGIFLDEPGRHAGGAEQRHVGKRLMQFGDRFDVYTFSFCHLLVCFLIFLIPGQK